jgi:hypothetical protein
LSRFRLFPRALLIALLVPVAGATFGIAGYRWEQARADWRPKVVRTATGWRISQVYGLRPVGPALAGDHLAWSAGPYTILLDLKTGRTKLLGAAHDAQSTWSPKLDDRYVVWLQATGSTDQAMRLWVYDTTTRRRVAVPFGEDAWGPPAVSGSTVYWSSAASQDTNQIIHGQDLLSRRQFIVGSASGSGGSLSFNGRLACWVTGQGTPGDPATIVVLDLIDAKRWSIPLVASSAGTSLYGFAAGGDRVAWLLWRKGTPSSAQIFVNDLATGQKKIVAAGPGVEQMAFDGTTVVWTVWSATTGKITIMGRRLDGTPAFEVARASDTPQEITVSGRSVAWLVDHGSNEEAWIETARLPQ